ncbi:MAG: hypothetical protein AAF726_22440 [Planctomycetota bacterium]
MNARIHIAVTALALASTALSSAAYLRASQGLQASSATSNENDVVRARTLIIEDEEGVEQMRLESTFGGARILIGPVRDYDDEFRGWGVELRAGMMGRPALLMKDMSFPQGRASIELSVDGQPASPALRIHDDLGVLRLEAGGPQWRRSGAESLTIRDGSDEIVWRR